MTLISRAGRRALREARKRLRLPQAERLGIRYVPPNVIYQQTIGPGDVVLDAGCADDADFSKHMIECHGAIAWGIDPTQKHTRALKRLAAEQNGRFHYLPAAIATESGKLTFHESDENVSGSLLPNHVNVLHDISRAYEVDALSLTDLTRRIGIDRIAILKLDLEGAEYEVLRRATREMLQPFDQLFVEFHHHAVSSYTEHDTRTVVRHVERLGFRSFTLDEHNYLFFHVV